MSKTETLLRINDTVASLPVNELSYYITLLAETISKEIHRTDKNAARRDQLLQALDSTASFATALADFYSKHEYAKPNSQKLQESFNNLIKAQKKLAQGVHATNSPIIIRTAIQVFNALVAVLTGIVLSPFCAVAGLFFFSEKKFSIRHRLKGTFLGTFTGFALGAIVGARLSSSILLGDYQRRLNYCITHTNKITHELMKHSVYTEYENQTKNYILSTYFHVDFDAMAIGATVYKDEEEFEKAYNKVFEDFLKEQQSFQVCTATAGHVSRSLKGHLGHHSLIRYSINNTIDMPIEFGDSGRTPNYVDQYEPERTVTGQKLFEMLVLHRILQKTHRINSWRSPTFWYYEVGANDCNTYINKILVGTHQAPSRLRRFDLNNDKYFGRNIAGPLLSIFSRVSEDALDNHASKNFTPHSDTYKEYQADKREENTDDKPFWRGVKSV